jgi:hypothetical protein
MPIDDTTILDATDLHDLDPATPRSALPSPESSPLPSPSIIPADNITTTLRSLLSIELDDDEYEYADEEDAREEHILERAAEQKLRGSDSSSHMSVDRHTPIAEDPDPNATPDSPPPLPESPSLGDIFSIQHPPPIQWTFELPENPSTRTEDFFEHHPSWFVQLILILVAYLNMVHGLSFRACDKVLWVLRVIFVATKLIPMDDPMPERYQTALEHLGLEDQFKIYPICVSCHKFFPVDSQKDAECDDCNERLYLDPTAHQLDMDVPSSSKSPPRLSVAYTPLASLLSSFVSRPDIEPHLDSWRNTADRDDGLFKDIMDGDVWKTIDGPNQEAFFNAQTEGQEIRLGLTMSLDWYVYFSQQLANSYLILNFCRFGITKSAYAPKHSTGVFSFGVANLGPSLRYDFPFFFSILVF